MRVACDHGAIGDFAIDTAVEPVDEGHYRATLSADWEIWGPMGGYVAAIAARAAGAEATHPRPVSFFCHFLGVARFETVDLEVTTIRRGRSAESLRVAVTQEGRPILEATVAVAAENEGLEHDEAVSPEVGSPEDLLSFAEQLAAEGRAPPFPFWNNLDGRPPEFRPDWPPPGPEEPVWRQWHKFLPRATFNDPWIDFGRYVLMCDLPSWPAAMRHHAWRWPDGNQEWIAPSIDLYVAVHRMVPDDPWLLVDGVSPIATDGLLGFRSTLWSSDRQLVASGGGQALFRRLPPAG